ncbi:MAG: 16S rRNA processing protein RimM [Candidatus Dadabacteria bacterium]|nr:16S rRNA processing protein RimM [Candidatus Dadabacteria bacterium]
MRLIIHSGDLSNLESIDSVYIRTGDTEEFTRYNIEGHSLSGKHVVLRLEGINSIEQADELKGTEVFVDDSQIEPAGRDEFYYYELEGLEVFDSNNNLLGKVIRLNDSGPQELLEVRLTSGKEVLIPFIEPILVEVDIDNKKIVVDPPPGLLDL